MSHCTNCGQEISETQESDFDGLCPECVRIQMGYVLNVSESKEKKHHRPMNDTRSTIAIVGCIILAILCGIRLFNLRTVFDEIIAIMFGISALFCLLFAVENT